MVYGKSECKVKDYSHDSTREDNVPCYSMVKVEAREYTDYEEVVTDAKKNNTQSDKSKATKELIYSKIHPTHPSGMYVVRYKYNYRYIIITFTITSDALLKTIANINHT